jgi:hypothetical protein
VFHLTENRLKDSDFHVERLATLEDIDGPGSLLRFLARARRGALAHLVRELVLVFATTRPKIAPSVKRYVENLLSGWLALRAPPARPL